MGHTYSQKVFPIHTPFILRGARVGACFLPTALRLGMAYWDEHKKATLKDLNALIVISHYQSP